MNIYTIREVAPEDLDAVRRTAERFCKRHGITHDGGADGAEFAIEFAIEHGIHMGGRDSRLKRLWVACYCRALGFKRPVSRVAIAFGQVGHRFY